MLLNYSPTSPFVRKITVLLHETGLADQVTLQPVDGWAEPDALTANNPLSMVPTLVLEDGSTLFDSPVICDFLDHRHRGARMLPPSGEARWQVLRDQALADGILDCAVLVFVEVNRRPEEKRWDWWLELKRRAIWRALESLEKRAPDIEPRVDLGSISIAVALAYLDLRGAVGEWRGNCPRLAAWFAGFSERPAMRATAPPV